MRKFIRVKPVRRKIRCSATLTTRKFVRYVALMTQIEQLLTVLRTYAAAKGLAEATVSTRFLGRGSRAADLANGGDMGSRGITAAIGRFAIAWPADVEWPVGVERPAPYDIIHGAGEGDTGAPQ